MFAVAVHACDGAEKMKENEKELRIAKHKLLTRVSGAINIRKSVKKTKENDNEARINGGIKERERKDCGASGTRNGERRNKTKWEQARRRRRRILLATLLLSVRFSSIFIAYLIIYVQGVRSEAKHFPE